MKYNPFLFTEKYLASLFVYDRRMARAWIGMDNSPRPREGFFSQFTVDW